jgi:hypothetical protein
MYLSAPVHEMEEGMQSVSKFACSALVLVVATVLALAAVDSAIAAKPVVIENATLQGNVLTVTVTNPNKKANQVAVAARYLEEGELILAQAFLSIAGQSTEDVSVTVRTITDDINPLSIIEGPDPISGTIAVSAIIWSD